MSENLEQTTISTKDSLNIQEPFLELNDLVTLQNFINSYSSGAGVTDISLKDLQVMLRNPYKNIQKIQQTARYMSNRFGIVKDVNEAYKTLPTLNYHLVWSNYENPTKITKYEKKIHEMLDRINVKKVVRDGLGTQAECGTCVPVNRKGKFIQFLDLDKIAIRQQINGKWVVEVDLSTISGTVKEIKAQIESLPEEVTLEKYNLYKRKTNDETRYVVINDAYVLSIRSERNWPFGFPYSFPAWNSILHKALIEQVEKSVADRKIKSLLVLYVNSIAKKDEAFKPPSKDIINNYFKELSNLLKKKDQGSKTGDSTVGTGVMALPSFFDLKEIEIDTEMFTKELYDKLDRDIHINLGVSEALTNGGGTGSNYGTSQMNSEKFFRYIFAALEDWEYMINDMIKSFLPNDLDCRFYFDRTTIGDRDKDIAAKKEFYLQTGIYIPWFESVLGVPYQYGLGLKAYQDTVLKDVVITPAQNAYTTPGGDNNSGGRPSNDNSNNSEGNIKAKASNSNSTPSPSD